MNWNSIAFDWNRTRAFLATAELGSLSAASRALKVTQPTLSRQVSALEKELGVLLFERSAHKLSLTPSGLELLHIAREMGDVAHKFSMIANGQSETLEGTVVISVCQLDAVYRLPPILSKLREEEPNISIELIVTNDISDLKRRDADIAVRSFQPTQPSLIARKIGSEKVHLYGTKEYLGLFSEAKSPSDVNNVQIIGFSNNSAIIEQLTEYDWHLTEKNFRLSTSFQPAQLRLCKEHQGLVYFPEDMAKQEPDLIRAFESFTPELHIPIWLVSHQELRTNLRVRRVFDFLATELKYVL